MTPRGPGGKIMKAALTGICVAMMLCSCSDVEYHTYITASPSGTEYSIWINEDSLLATSGDTILITEDSGCISTRQKSDGNITLDMQAWKSAGLGTVFGPDQYDVDRASSADSGMVATVCTGIFASMKN